MKQRIRVKHDRTLQERLDEQACIKQEAGKASSEAYRDKEASRLEKWLASPGLRRPT